MLIDFSDLSGSECYHMMTQVIVPRPIAWVLTDNGNGDSYNLAPYSYFNALSSEPPLVMISAGTKPGGEHKDTRANLLERSYGVIHIPSVSDAESVTKSAATLAHGESEVEHLGLSLTQQPGWVLPRLSHCDIAMAVHFYDVVEIGPNKQAILFCQIDHLYASDRVAARDQQGRIRVDATALSPLSRLGASEYAELGKVFRLSRPK